MYEITKTIYSQWVGENRIKEKLPQKRLDVLGEMELVALTDPTLRKQVEYRIISASFGEKKKRDDLAKCYGLPSLTDKALREELALEHAAASYLRQRNYSIADPKVGSEIEGVYPNAFGILTSKPTPERGVRIPFLRRSENLLIGRLYFDNKFHGAQRDSTWILLAFGMEYFERLQGDVLDMVKRLAPNVKLNASLDANKPQPEGSEKEFNRYIANEKDHLLKFFSPFTNNGH